MKAFLEWLLGFFSKKTEKQEVLENRVEEHKEKLKEIEDEELSDDDITDYLND